MPEYEVYAIRFSTNDERRSPQNFLNGDPHDDPMPMDFYLWAIKNGERTVLVDSGFDAARAKGRGREIMRPVNEGLAQIGVSCDSVEDIVVTHMHWDHVGNHDMFPRARYHIQDAEMAYCTGRCMCHKTMRYPFEPSDVTNMVNRVFEDRVSFYNGSAEPWPDISIHLVGGHSAGMQIVRVRTKRGWVVLASDSSHYYANIRQERPYPIIHNLENMFEGYRKSNELASSYDHIIPGHDPLVLTYYPRANPNIEGTVRLDVDPIAR
jgi:glyoxylase-like metal-dependent hydrolase (beta-lactamase superfamily II)